MNQASNLSTRSLIFVLAGKQEGSKATFSMSAEERKKAMEGIEDSKPSLMDSISLSEEAKGPGLTSQEEYEYEKERRYEERKAEERQKEQERDERRQAERAADAERHTRRWRGF
jgi:hypothetical protein